MSGLGRAFAQAQERFDNMLPPDIDDVALTEEEARERAENELHMNPWAILCNLQMYVAESDSAPVADYILGAACRFDPLSLTAPQLLVLAMRESSFGRELMNRFLAAQQRDINARAAELIREQEAA